VSLVVTPCSLVRGHECFVGGVCVAHVLISVQKTIRQTALNTKRRFRFAHVIIKACIYMCVCVCVYEDV